MEKYFVTYAQSLALKELGFDEPCFRHALKKLNTVKFNDNLKLIINWNSNDPFGNVTSIPLKSQVFEWFRKEKDLYSEIRTFVWDYDNKQLGFSIRTYLNPMNVETERLIHPEVYESYEEAESACIDKLIEIARNL